MKPHNSSVTVFYAASHHEENSFRAICRLAGGLVIDRHGLGVNDRQFGLGVGGLLERPYRARHSFAAYLGCLAGWGIAWLGGCFGTGFVSQPAGGPLFVGQCLRCFIGRGRRFVIGTMGLCQLCRYV